ncbi:MAG TPA: hypothetical protein VKV79_03065 [Terriglobia bacterium]|nr:hypothetical protein [Terriglobia bacterium]
MHPARPHTYQSDVETVHRLIEDEFYDLETFASRSEFLAKATLYQHDFNLAPWPIDLCLLPPVFLDYHLNDQGGYDVNRLYQQVQPLACGLRQTLQCQISWLRPNRSLPPHDRTER